MQPAISYIIQVSFFISWNLSFLFASSVFLACSINCLYNIIACIFFLLNTIYVGISKNIFKLKNLQKVARWVMKFNVNILHSNRRESDTRFFFFLICHLVICLFILRGISIANQCIKLRIHQWRLILLKVIVINFFSWGILFFEI